VDRTAKATERKSVFLDIKIAQNYNLRFLPTSMPTGDLFFVSAQHHNFKEDDQKRAWACLRVHGTEGQDCPICRLVEAAEFADAEKYKKLIDTYKVAWRWHAQVVHVVADQEVEQLSIVGLSKNTANDVSSILKMERDNRQPLLVDPDKGQAINIARNDKTGLGTRYKVQATGLRLSLDEIYPKWTEEFLDVEKAVALRIVETERLIASIQTTVGNNVLRTLLPDLA
jgi:dsDNA-binding SOS-regulon protein